MNKKGAAAVVLGVLLIVVLSAWALWEFGGECRSDSACEEGFYCGVDNTCHKIPIVEKTIEKNTLLLPSIIIASAIVLSAVLLAVSRLRKHQQLQEYYHNYYTQWYQQQVSQAPDDKLKTLPKETTEEQKEQPSELKSTK